MKAETKRHGMERKIVQCLLLGQGPNRIARELRVSKRRVLMVRAKADEAGYLEGSQKLPEYPQALFAETSDGRSLRVSAAWRELEAHKEWMRERLEAGWHAITVYEELPLRVSRSSFYRFLERHSLDEVGRSVRRVVPEIVHEPGEALLIDWGHLWTAEKDGKRRKIWVFIGVLGYSRYMVARVMVSCDQEHTLAALGSLYEDLGGVPRRTTSDNPKVFALEAHRYEPLLNPIYESFGSHYGTVIECLPPRDPQKKGKVERPVPYVRRLMEAFAGDRSNVEEIEQYLQRKLVLANKRKHGTTGELPVVRFMNEEQATLRILPLLPWEQLRYHEGTVRIDGHVRFEGKYYSVSENYVRKPVTVIGSSRQVSIYHAGKLIETHDRVTDRNRSKSTKRHHLKPWEQVCNNPEGLKGLANKLGPCVLAVVEDILRKGDGFIDLRRIWGILSLDKKYPKDEIDRACQRALSEENLTYRGIQRFLRESEDSQLATEPSPRRSPGKFQHDLSEYTQLLLTFDKGDAYEY